MATALAIAVLSFSSAPSRVPTVAHEGEPPNADEQACSGDSRHCSYIPWWPSHPTYCSYIPWQADVLILCAGMSGVAAAAVLHKAGVSFLIIEGTDRIGGRVKVAQFAGKQIEEGAYLIHGARKREGDGNVAHNNILWDLAQQVGRPHSPDRSRIARQPAPLTLHHLLDLSAQAGLSGNWTDYESVLAYDGEFGPDAPVPDTHIRWGAFEQAVVCLHPKQLALADAARAAGQCSSEDESLRASLRQVSIVSRIVTS
jgi:hypothetical protein